VVEAEKNVDRADKLTQVSIFVADKWEPGVFVLLAPAVAGLLALLVVPALLVPIGGAAAADVPALLVPAGGAAAWLSLARAPNAGSESLLSMLLALGARLPRFLIA
jgi:hypothetical protein